MTKGFNLKNGIHYLIGYRLEWDAAFDPAGMPDSLPEGIKSIIGDICTRYQYQVMQMRMERGHISLCLSCPYTVAPGDTVDRKSTRLNSSHSQQSRMPSSA